MGRTPCCKKMGLNKGPWTPEEDQKLASYIGLHGYSNWRALPKKAGLFRCGKSCRLRWINYLNPDIKRGNFTQEEEETIFKLHEMLGNRWSAIAAKLPGRTDNEIKNIWHTHLKKRLTKQNEQSGSTTTLTVVGTTEKQARKSRASTKSKVALEAVSIDNDIDKNHNKEKEDRKVRPMSSIECELVSPQTCTSEYENVSEKDGYTANLSEVNDDFWMEVFSPEDIAMSTEEFAMSFKDFT